MLNKNLRRQAFIFWAVLFLFVLVLNPPVRAATEEDQVKAVFLYNLVNFVNWPENALNDCDSFIITVVGQSRFADLVGEAVKNEFKANLKLEVQYLKELNKDQYNNCCGMIFIDQKYLKKEVAFKLKLVYNNQRWLAYHIVQKYFVLLV